MRNLIQIIRSSIALKLLNCVHHFIRHTNLYANAWLYMIEPAYVIHIIAQNQHNNLFIFLFGLFNWVRIIVKVRLKTLAYGIHHSHILAFL